MHHHASRRRINSADDADEALGVLKHLDDGLWHARESLLRQGLAAAAANAAMLEHALALTGVPRATARAGGWTGIPDRLAQRDVEGVGGQAWYEGPRDGLCV